MSDTTGESSAQPVDGGVALGAVDYSAQPVDGGEALGR